LFEEADNKQGFINTKQNNGNNSELHHHAGLMSKERKLLDKSADNVVDMSALKLDKNDGKKRDLCIARLPATDDMRKKAYCAVVKAHNRNDTRRAARPDHRSCHSLEDNLHKSPIWVASKQMMATDSPEGTLTYNIIGTSFSLSLDDADPNGLHPDNLTRSLVAPSLDINEENLVPMTKFEVEYMNFYDKMNTHMKVRAKFHLPLFMHLIIIIGRIKLADTSRRNHRAC
jgi:hypothetical protein